MNTAVQLFFKCSCVTYEHMLLCYSHLLICDLQGSLYLSLTHELVRIKLNPALLVWKQAYINPVILTKVIISQV